ncbi:hypothetical protein Asp14428_16180 [Actinoplanes sp. NBRC 14428]|uniref:Uncharacterized protein DUF2267 n=1 Tax=Pseudosporangium ferrugineum TaxID=439699 RepID=A0A2T0SB03_9ACTN|nr:DUF2267 domain-containing protein [Pseudosporangium ferrugineum]PRY30600.1 uncharacterized protein DUF2267 [Pseudosporangium ferrugineum]BCJ50143.1 hypothetical protein Asp14428_16180 [Actinoplanes sp. NBRC 14428]
MHRDDLLSHVRTRARLHGRGHAQRVVEAVVHGLRGVVPEASWRGLTAQLPFAVGAAVARAEPVGGGACRALIRDVARRLNVAEPDAAFYARVTFEQLNAFCQGITPARLAASAPADLRPLLSARAEESAHRSRRRLATLGTPVSALTLRTHLATPRTVTVRADSKRPARSTPAERR